MIAISPEARIYALRELTRRAGVDPSLFAKWHIELQPDKSLLWVGERACIQFPNAGLDFWRELANGKFRVARAKWTFPAANELGKLIPDLIVPFAETEISGPLFRLTDQGQAECRFDLPTSVWLTLSRFEETLPSERDVHGRFAANQSLAFRHGFLNRPVIDELGLALEQVLRVLLAGWQPRRRELRVKLSHDIDFVGIPFRVRSTAGHLFSRGNPGAALRDVLSTFTNARPAELESVSNVAQLASHHGLRSAMYWKTNSAGQFDSAYSLRHPKIAEMVTELSDAGVEMGVHPGYSTFLAPEKLAEEVSSAQEVFEQRELGGRQHFLRWSPETWRHWEMCGLSYDSSVGFHDAIGFRAGTCFPYRPWLLGLNREAELLEIPLLVMDVTLSNYMHANRETSLGLASDIVETCKTVGGVFAFLWHNDSLLVADSKWVYEQLLSVVSGTSSYDWHSEFERLGVESFA